MKHLRYIMSFSISCCYLGLFFFSSATNVKDFSKESKQVCKKCCRKTLSTIKKLEDYQ